MGQHGNLTDRKINSLKPAAPGKHYDTWERDGFGVRVSDRGTRTFVLMARYHGAKSHPTRRAIGHYPTVTLAQARETAAQWRQWITQGKDPAIEIERQKAAEFRKHEVTFAAVAKDFIDTKVSKERASRESARIITRVLVREWGRRPITDISALEVRNLVKRYVDAGKRTQAHHVLAMLRRLYNWAADQLVYGIETSPCDRLKPKAIIGARKPRTRVLTDIELRATWKAAALLGYPYGPLFQILMLTGQRRTEASAARWREFDLDKRLWTIPAERAKGGAVHVVPLSDDALAILEALPRFRGGDFVFTSTGGRKPLNGLAKAKVRLDAHIIEILRDVDPAITLQPFVTHDLRRTCRTGLSSIPGISDLVRELIIGHTRPGLHKVYDQHAYIAEKQHGLDAWAARLRSIVDPPLANVVPLQARA